MRNPRTLERLSGASFAVTIALSSAMIAAPYVLRAMSEGREGATVETRARLDRLRAVRSDSDTGSRDERFDALLASLAAGLGPDAPDGLGQALDRVVAARESERAAVAQGKSRDAKRLTGVESDVDVALVAASRMLDETSQRPGTTAVMLVAATGTLPWALAASVLVGMIATIAARSARREKLSAIAALLGCDRHDAEDTDLVASVNRHVDLACEAAVRRALERAGRSVPQRVHAVAVPTRTIEVGSRPVVPATPIPASHLEPHIDPACGVRALVEEQDYLDTGDYDLDTPIPGCDSFRISEIKALPLDEMRPED